MSILLLPITVRHDLRISSCRRSAVVLSLLLLAGLLLQAASACQICVPMPVRTLADRLIEADAVVLAREDAERPFHFSVVEILKGDPVDAPIDAFLNSVSRRLLATYPDRHMVLSRDARDGEWVSRGIADADFERVVRHVIGQSASWKPMEGNNPQRLAYFAPLLGHPDSRLHELAYLEVARAPYATIRSISKTVSIDTVRAMLDDPRYLEWRSLAILMLAQSEQPSDRERILKTFDEKQRLASSLNLAAWATAYIAIEGTRGVERIRERYLSQSSRSREELREILRALSVHGAGGLPLREAVLTAYRTLLEVHPALAPEITHDLIAWRHWDLAGPIREIRSAMAGKNPLGAYALDFYLRMAAAGLDGLAEREASSGAPAPE